MAIVRSILACLLVATCAAALDAESERLVQHYQKQYLQHYEAHVKTLSLKSDEPVEKEPKCPEKEVTAPCTCTVYQKTLNLHCNGTDVTQDHIENAVALIRKENNLQSYDKLVLASFILTQTEMETLDLTPFADSEVTFLLTVLNQNLSKIVGPAGVRSDQPSGGLVNSTFLMIIGSQQLDNAGFDNTLSYFEPTMVFLALAVTGIEGGQYPVKDGSGDIEFLPSLSSYSKLMFLLLGGNPIKTVGGGQFKRNSNLISLSLGSKLTELGADSFIFQENTENSWLILDLGFNPLTDASFQSVQVNGLASGQRPIHLSATFTKLTTLSEQNFAPFFRANDKNRLNVQYNKFQCDRNMRWLNKNRKYYESRVLNARCSNDNNRSVFDSKKAQ